MLTTPVKPECMHTPRKKWICTRACVHMQRCRRFFAMEAVANLSRVLREHRACCRLPLALAACPAVSTKPVTRGCLLKKSVQIYASSWRGRRCGVVQASFDHPRWCKPHPVCLWVALTFGCRPHPWSSVLAMVFVVVLSLRIMQQWGAQIVRRQDRQIRQGTRKQE